MKKETREKLSEALMGNQNAKGKPKPEGFGEMISKKLKGLKRTDEQRRRISEGKKGHKVTAKTRGKISKANKGRKRTHEQKLRMAEAQKSRYELQRMMEDESQDRIQLQDSSGNTTECL